MVYVASRQTKILFRFVYGTLDNKIIMLVNVMPSRTGHLLIFSYLIEGPMTYNNLQSKMAYTLIPIKINPLCYNQCSSNDTITMSQIFY